MVKVITATLMSLIIPGTGQIASGKVKKGIIFLAIEAILYRLFLTVTPVLSLYQFYLPYMQLMTHIMGQNQVHTQLQHKHIFLFLK